MKVLVTNLLTGEVTEVEAEQNEDIIVEPTPPKPTEEERISALEDAFIALMGGI